MLRRTSREFGSVVRVTVIDSRCAAALGSTISGGSNTSRLMAGEAEGCLISVGFVPAVARRWFRSGCCLGDSILPGGENTPTIIFAAE